MKLFFILIVSFQLVSPLAWSWGRRGHEIIAFVASELLAEKENKSFMRSHSFDLGYYANIPDILFRGMGSEIDKLESPQHFLDWDKDLDQVFKTPQELPVEFKKYKDAIGDKFDRQTGLAPWRISDLNQKCQALISNLSRETQGPLLVCLGVLSHYIGDLSMPLHNAKNYDGQLSGQKGIHKIFESLLVEQLEPQMRMAVLKEAKKLWPKFDSKKRNVDEWVRWLIADGFKDVDTLLKTDKRSNRKDLKGSARKFEPLLIKRLAVGSLVVAQIWKSLLKDMKKWDSNGFYFFDHKPSYFYPEYEEIK